MLKRRRQMQFTGPVTFINGSQETYLKAELPGTEAKEVHHRNSEYKPEVIELQGSDSYSGAHGMAEMSGMKSRM